MDTFFVVLDTKTGQAYTYHAGHLSGPAAQTQADRYAEHLFPNRHRGVCRPINSCNKRITVIAVK